MSIDWNHFTPLASGSGAALLFTLVLVAAMLLHDRVRTLRRRTVAPA